MAAIIKSRSTSASKRQLGSGKTNQANRSYNIDDEDSGEEEEEIEMDQKQLWERIQGFVKEHEVDPDQITISVKKLQQEAKLKYDRSSRVSAGWKFLCFFALYAAVMIIQKNADQSEKVTSSLIDYLVSSHYPSKLNTAGTEWPDQDGPGMQATGCFTDNCATPTYLTKGFLDIMDVADFWEWMEHQFLDLIYTVTASPPPPPPRALLLLLLMSSSSSTRHSHTAPAPPASALTDRARAPPPPPPPPPPPRAPQDASAASGVAANSILLHTRRLDSARWLQQRALPGAALAGAISADCWTAMAGPIRPFAVRARPV